MKKTFILLTFLNIFVVGCMSLATREQLDKQDIYDFPKLDSSTIYKKTLEWIAADFASGKTVLEYQNEKEGKIICQINVAYNRMGAIPHAATTMTINIKNEKAKISFIPRGLVMANGLGPLYEMETEELRKSIIKISEAYKSFILKKQEDSNW